jgi:hypothetical protein
MKGRIDPHSLTVTVEKTLLSILAGMKIKWWKCIRKYNCVNRLLLHYIVLEITASSVHHVHLVILFCK